MRPADRNVDLFCDTPLRVEPFERISYLTGARHRVKETTMTKRQLRAMFLGMVAAEAVKKAAKAISKKRKGKKKG